MPNKLLKYTPATKSMASAGQPTLRFGCPLAKKRSNKPLCGFPPGSLELHII